MGLSCFVVSLIKLVYVGVGLSRRYKDNTVVYSFCPSGGEYVALLLLQPVISVNWRFILMDKELPALDFSYNPI